MGLFSKREKNIPVLPEPPIHEVNLRDGLHFPGKNPVFAKPIPPRREEGGIEAADNDGVVDQWSQEVRPDWTNEGIEVVNKFFRGLFN